MNFQSWIECVKVIHIDFLNSCDWHVSKEI